MSTEPMNRPNSRLSDWLPPLRQVLAALQFRLEAVIGATRKQETSLPGETISHSAVATSMRQGLGLVVSLALLAGLLPFLVNWVNAERAGTALPLAQLTLSM